MYSGTAKMLGTAWALEWIILHEMVVWPGDAFIKDLEVSFKGLSDWFQYLIIQVPPS